MESYSGNYQKINRHYSSVIKSFIDVVQSQSGEMFIQNSCCNTIYGSNQKNFMLAMDQIQVQIQNAKTIVIIGIGDGSIIRMLRNKQQYRGQIHVIELDQALANAVLQDFGLKGDSNTVVHLGNAHTVLAELDQKSDISMVNLFTEPFLQKKSYTIAFWEQIVHTLQPNGTVLCNTNSSYINNINHILSYMIRNGFDQKEIHTHNLKDIYVWERGF